MKQYAVNEHLGKLAEMEKRMLQWEKSAYDQFSKKNFDSLKARLERLESLILERSPSAPYQLAEEVSGIVGLKEALTAKSRSLQFVWTTFLVLGIGATAYFLFSTTNDYLAEPTLTKITRQSQPAYAFPPIVLCNDAWFDTKKALDLGLSTNALVYSLGYWYDGILHLDHHHLNSSRTEFLAFYEKRNFSSLIDYYKAISVDVNATTSSEEFENATSSSYQLTRNTVGGRKIFLPGGSVCYEYTLDSMDGRVSRLFNVTGMALKYRDRTDGIAGPQSQNWKLHLNNDARALYTWPLAVRQNTRSSVTIKLQVFRFYNRPEAPCLDQADYVSLNCIVDCIGQMTADVLPCRSAWPASEDTAAEPTDYCNFLEPSFNLSILSAKLIEEIKNQCSVKCPLKCERNLYEATLNVVEDLGTDGNGNLSTTLIGFLHGAVYQGGIFLTEEVRSYSFTALINAVGGSLGLFVGGTVMTFVQMIMFVVNRFCGKRVKQ